MAPPALTWGGPVGGRLAVEVIRSAGRRGSAPFAVVDASVSHAPGQFRGATLPLMDWHKRGQVAQRTEWLIAVAVAVGVCIAGWLFRP